MTILLVAEHDNQSLSEQTAKSLSAALAIGGEIDILVAGKGADTVAAEAAKLGGVRKVLHVENDALENQLAEPLASTIMDLADGYETFIAPATSTGKNVMPRVAALLDVMQVSEVIEIVSPTIFKRPIYAGNATQTVETSDTKKVLTIRTASFSLAQGGGSAPVETISCAASPTVSSFLENIVSKSDRPELTASKIVVSGGRGLGSREKFEEVILPLVDKLGGAVGASRAAVDAGYAPNDWQVGQTGKIVAPDLYIAIGISGAIQHLAGMKDSRVIVAINKDEDAPIFQIADYGLVGDLFDLIPEFEKRV